MTMTPAELKYTKEHEWVREDGDGVVTVGITDFAQDQLGDVVYLQLPDSGTTLTQFERMGEIESVKSVSELFSPVSGEVVERNEDAIAAPEKVNASPYGDGWLVRVRLAGNAELDNLLSAEAYESLIQQAGGH